MRRLTRVLVVVALLAFAAGCGSGSGGGGDWPAGRTFIVTKVKGHTLPTTTEVSLLFTDGEIRARGGCNTFAGEAYVDQGRLVVEDLASTAMACPDDADHVDGWLVRFLRGKPTWRLSGDTLTLRRKGVVVTLVDDEVARPDRALRGTKWKLESLSDGEVAKSVPAGVSAHLTLSKDGKVTGNAGCNQIRGAYDATDSTITFSRIAGTRMSCGKDADRVEGEVLGILRGSVKYQVKGDVLTLRHESGGSLQFRAG